MKYPTRNMGKGYCDKQDNGSLKTVHVLIPSVCKYVTLHGKRDFADVIKLGIMRWGDDPGLSGWAQ